jgi:hypothetical protein
VSPRFTRWAKEKRNGSARGEKEERREKKERGRADLCGRTERRREKRRKGRKREAVACVREERRERKEEKEKSVLLVCVFLFVYWWESRVSKKSEPPCETKKKGNKGGPFS